MIRATFSDDIGKGSNIALHRSAGALLHFNNLSFSRAAAGELGVRWK